ncbi:CsbD family protein [Arthrobacter sp. NPDC057259]|uniref:CsbD family protein n=1 Tax=Arthrobacter sp. NPDC057259 TaxID=3346073 RepID=UPI00363DD6E3
MGIDDKANIAVTNHPGAAKEGAGKLTGNEQLEREGQQDQAKAQLQDAGEKIKDAAADVGGNLREAARKIKEGFSKN